MSSVNCVLNIQYEQGFRQKINRGKSFIIYPRKAKATNNHLVKLLIDVDEQKVPKPILAAF